MPEPGQGGMGRGGERGPGGAAGQGPQEDTQPQSPQGLPRVLGGRPGFWLPCPHQLASPGICSFSTYTNTYNSTKALGFIQSRLYTRSVPFESTCPHPLLPQKQDEISVSSRLSFKPPGYQG